MIVRTNLCNARKAKGMTQREMSKVLGISEVYYRKIEAGDREGRGKLWDNLEALFDYEIQQRELRINE